MRGKHHNSLANAWKKLNNDQQKYFMDSIYQKIGYEARDPRYQRDGELYFGSLQLTNYISSEYLRLGGRGGGTVGP